LNLAAPKAGKEGEQKTIDPSDHQDAHRLLPRFAGQAKNAFDKWSMLLARRFAELRGVAPKQ